MTVPSQRRELGLIALALAFGWLGALSLWLQSHDATIVTAMLLLTACGTLAHFWLNRVAPNRDGLLLPVTLALTAWGFVIGARVAANFLPRQAVWMVIGVLALCAVAASRDRLRWLRRFKYTWLIAGLVLLAATLLLGVNPTGAGARLWLSVAGFFVQPSEVLRLLMIAFLAAFFSEQVTIGHRSASVPSESWRFRLRGRKVGEVLRSLAPLAPSFVMWLVALSLLATQQDLGAATLLLVTYAVMLYLATGQALLPGLALAMLLITGVIGYHFSSRVALRIDIWLNPWHDPQGTSFQIVQSLIAVANGGIFGQGPGQGRPDYVPAVHTDFPFAAIGEEYGLVGALAVLILFAVLTLRAWRIARGGHSSYALLLAGGIAALFGMQVFVIVGGNLGLLPLTGVTLPFVSYGGSSLLVSYVAVGLLIRLSCDHLTNGAAIIQPFATPPLYPNGDAVYKTVPAQQVAARRVMLLCTAMIAVLGVVTGYWDIFQRDSLVSRNDNPRNVDAERSINRGAIFARDGSVLAFSQEQPAQAPFVPSSYVRVYPINDVVPIVGYYSIQYGSGGIEAYDDAGLRSGPTELGQLLHATQKGQAIITTVDLREQARLTRALTGTVGAAIILDWHTGEVLALVSNPTFDPNTLDVNWDSLRERADAPLVNRATQGLYQPGALLGWIYAGGRGNATQTRLQQWDTADRFHLGQPVPFELQNASVPYPATASYSETVGQGTLRLSPLRVAVTAATLAAGSSVTPTLITGRANRYASDSPPKLTAETSVLAQMSQGTHVGWYVKIDSQHVTVLALEMHSNKTDALDAVIRRLQ
jgi:cell division protein FtsW (lipid II flippase)